MEDKQSNLNTLIGMGLIFILVYLWMQYAAPARPVENVEQNTTSQTDTARRDSTPNAALSPSAPDPRSAADSTGLSAALKVRYGAFAAATRGTEEQIVLENDLARITFSNKGGRITEVFLKNYEKVSIDSAWNDVKGPATLLDNPQNRFSLQIPLRDAAAGSIETEDLFFSASKQGNTVVFRAEAGEGRYLEQRYTLSPDNYHIDYAINAPGLNELQPEDKRYLRLNWINRLNKLEKNQDYERTMSTVYFKAADAKTDYCNCRSDDTEALGDKEVKWFSHANQFFNTSLMAKDFAFREFTGSTRMLDKSDSALKVLETSAVLPLDKPSLNMAIYAGPNEFDRLTAYNNSLQDIIPFGASIFGSINRWIIHPMLDFLSRFIGSKGIVILILTLLIKLLLFPLTYRMVYGQARMAALKPQLESLRKKHGDDQQAMSMETMKLYSEYRVNPLSGCLPILLQMPVWFALYRFFPAAIEFRQASFLWAPDLSSYDAAFKLGFEMPGFGGHISAFTLIWVVTTLWYTWYSMKQMDTGAMQTDQMKVMKYMQFGMPVMFMFFFNSFASGLTLYLCFSNLLNIGQTVGTKKFLINHDKIKAELEANKNKPRKQGGFRERLEQAMKEQQRLQAEREKAAARKKK